MLKSDHFGIEIKYGHDHGLTQSELKSDHFGIEMNLE